MADWHAFGYEGKPGTCVWCGKKLRLEDVARREASRHLVVGLVRQPGIQAACSGVRQARWLRRRFRLRPALRLPVRGPAGRAGPPVAERSEGTDVNQIVRLASARESRRELVELGHRPGSHTLKPRKGS
jgi:hypothetical protein